MPATPSVEDTIEWLRDRPYYAGQISDHRIVDGRDPTFSDLDVHRSLASALTQQGISDLYEHQVTAIRAVRDDQNVVIATPTASGKSLAYTVPAIERALKRDQKTLYLAPTRALINDQHDTLSEYAEALGFDAQVEVAKKTGATSRSHDRQVKNDQPDVLLATLDQLHLSLIPYAHSPQHWKWLFQQIGTVVIDEIHQYRGTLGTHASLIFRRFARLADYYDADPEFVCCSATIGNPVDHAATVTGQPTESFELVDTDTSATGDRHWLLWNPPLKEDAEADVDGEERADAGGVLTGPTGDGVTPERDASTATRDGEMVRVSGDELRAGHDPRPPEKLSTDPAVPETRIDGAEVPVDPRAADGGAPQTMSSGESETETSRTRALPTYDEVEGGDRLSQHAESVKLFCDLVTKGYQTLVFTRARQGAEQYARWSENILRDRGQRDLADNIHAYHGSLTPDDRVGIEAALRDGTARGAWSTNALEVGVDIGTLDVVLLDGYPGTLMETFQRAGRAGRGDDECLVIVVGGDDPLDQYMLSNPDEIFAGEPEAATLNPANRTIQPDHVVCAARDHYLSPDDDEYFEGEFPEVVSTLTDQGRLRRTDEEQIRWAAAEDNPRWNTDIRNIDETTIEIRDRHTDEELGSLAVNDALRDVHPEAIYVYRGQSYKIVELDLELRQAYAEKVDTTAYTRALRDKRITIEDTLDSGTISFSGQFSDRGGNTIAGNDGDAGDGDDVGNGVDVGVSDDSIEIRKTLANLTVSSHYENYLYHTNPSDENPEEREIPEDLPPYEIETRGLFIEIPSPIESEMKIAAGADDGYLSALHAVEHTLISLFPRAVLCDRNDIGGLSIEHHPQTAGGTIFVHDAYEGGAGYSRAAYEQLGELLERTYETIRECPCESGCPSCIHSPQCGNANRTLSKHLAKRLLQLTVESA